jgi:hypothetical protein
MKVGLNIGNETISIEYKEFCFQNLIKYFNKEDLYNLIYNYKNLNKQYFNNMIDDILEKYFIKYIPKYLASFSKANIDGHLYIGVSDIGNLEGIPYMGNINKKFIAKLLKKSIEYNKIIYTTEHSSSNTKSNIYHIYNKLNVELIKLEFLNELELDEELNKVNKILYELEYKNNILIHKMNDYNIKYYKWQKKLNIYSIKLINLLTNSSIREEIKEYIINQFKLEPSLNQNRLINILKYFNKKDSYYKNMVFTLEYIENIINDVYHPIRWLTKFKDYKLAILRKEKPIQPIHKPNNLIYHLFCNNISNFRSYLNKSNNNINYYIIKINIPNFDDIFNKLNISHIEYRDESSFKWMSKSRILNNFGQPISSYEI